MIYLVCLSPSLDYFVNIDDFKIGEINRSHHEVLEVGGKGINIARDLKVQNINASVLGFVAGFTGEQLKENLTDIGISNTFINVGGMTRINIKINSKEETAINTTGLDICEKDIRRLKEQLQNITSHDLLVISGSIPSSIRKTLYEELIKEFIEKNVTLIVDSEGNLALNTLKYHPYLIKPNLDELSGMVNKDIKSKEDLIESVKILQNLGAKNIIVSLGNNGAILFLEDGSYIYKEALKVDVLSTVGCGDALISGVIAGLNNSYSLVDAFNLGIAVATAHAEKGFSKTIDDIYKYHNLIKNK